VVHALNDCEQNKKFEGSLIELQYTLTQNFRWGWRTKTREKNEWIMNFSHGLLWQLRIFLPEVAVYLLNLWTYCNQKLGTWDY